MSFYFTGIGDQDFAYIEINIIRSDLDAVNQDSYYNSINFNYSLVITCYVIYHRIHLAFRRLDLLENDCELCDI